MLSNLAVNTQQAIDKNQQNPDVTARWHGGWRDTTGSIATSQLQGLGFDPNVDLLIMHTSRWNSSRFPAIVYDQVHSGTDKCRSAWVCVWCTVFPSGLYCQLARSVPRLDSKSTGSAYWRWLSNRTGQGLLAKKTFKTSFIWLCVKVLRSPM